MAIPARPEPDAIQPKSVRRLVIRFAIGLLTLAILVLAYRALKTYGRDIDFPVSVDTADWIAAVEILENGSQVVLFDAEGKMRRSPGYQNGVAERSPVWSPNGNRVFFSSDREDEAYNIYRWNPGSNRVERRSFGRGSKANPSFPPEGAPQPNDAMLLTSSGRVLELTPVDGTTYQVLPPVPKGAVRGEEGGVMGQMDEQYKGFGRSFREAKWTKDKNKVAAVMKREDGSEVLIVQDLTNPANLIPLAAGAHIEFDVSTTGNQVFYSITDFRFVDLEHIPPQFIKDGRILVPFRHGIGIFDPDARGTEMIQVLATTNDNENAFGEIEVSPEGAFLLASVGKYGSQRQFEPHSLMVFPTKEASGAQAIKVTSGDVRDISWRPDSGRVVFTRGIGGGKRAIFTIRSDGRDEQRISPDGDFRSPVFSPQRGR